MTRSIFDDAVELTPSSDKKKSVTVPTKVKNARRSKNKVAKNSRRKNRRK